MKKIEIGNVYVVIGVYPKRPGKKPLCKICGLQIKNGDQAICTHILGEYPSQFHLTCFEEFLNKCKEEI